MRPELPGNRATIELIIQINKIGYYKTIAYLGAERKSLASANRAGLKNHMNFFAN